MKARKGYCAMSRGHSCVLDMKTQCMRTKSSTAGSGRERKKTREQREIKWEKEGSDRLWKGSAALFKLKPPVRLCAVVIFYWNLLPGSLGCMSILIVSRKCSRIFSGVPDITVYLQETRNSFKGAVRDIISPLDVADLCCMYNETNRLPVHAQQPHVVTILYVAKFVFPVL